MNQCIKLVGGKTCKGHLIKYGIVNGSQRYRCKQCRYTQMGAYQYKAYLPEISLQIVSHVKEGCGIRSIARLLDIAAGTVISRIKRIASGLRKPKLESGGTFEVDELRTYVKNRHQECWIIYALNRHTGTIADMKIGKRCKENIKEVIDTLLAANGKCIYTDKLSIYRYLIPAPKHRICRYGTNHIERMNLSLRTDLKRLSRKTICYSKTQVMLEACLRVYFWA